MSDDICMTCGCINGGHFNCYTDAENRAAQLAARNKVLTEALERIADPKTKMFGMEIAKLALEGKEQ